MVNQVLWITLDSTPLALWGCYGNLQGWTPHLDAFAANGIVFDEHHATRKTVRPSGEQPKWEALLAAAGETIEVNSCLAARCEGPVSRHDSTVWKELEQKLDSAVHRLQENLKPALICCTLPRLQGELSSDEDDEEDLMEDEAPPPRGFPYELLSEEKRTGAIQDLVFLDDWLGTIQDLWDEAASDEVNPWLVVTAARGDSFPFATTEEHHGPEELLAHIPLLILNRSGLPAGERVRELTSEDDLGGALLELLTHGDADSGLWRKFLQGETAELPETLVWRDSEGDPVLRTTEGLLMGGDPVRLFHLPEDRWGLQDVSHSEEELSESLQAELRKKLATDRADA